jgi:hypothetical protein
VVFQNEIFERTANRNSRARDFGVIFGEKNVSIYIEPKRDNFRQTTSRSSLLQKDGNSLPWEVWQEEFRINMPDELTNYMDSIISQIDDSVNVDSIKERLKKYVKFFKVGKYRLSKKGDVLVDPDNLVSGRSRWCR